MTDRYTGPISPDDIDGEADVASLELEREADAILVEGEAHAFGPRPVHEAMRYDAMMARAWSRTRAERLRRAVEEEPVRATLYALGLGVVIGMLIAR